MDPCARKGAEIVLKGASGWTLAREMKVKERGKKGEREGDTPVAGKV